MVVLRQKAVSAVLIAALALSPVGAVANTRASDGGPTALPASAAQVGTFPYSSWLVPEDDDAAAIWEWVLAGALEVAIIYAYLSNGSEGTRSGPTHASNGAN